MKIKYLLLSLLCFNLIACKDKLSYKAKDKNSVYENEIKRKGAITTDSASFYGLKDYKALGMLNEDLDGDGVKDKVIFKASPKCFEYDKYHMGAGPIIIQIGSQFVLSNLWGAPSGNGSEFYTSKIVDIDTSDNLKEILFCPKVFGIDPPGDYQIIRFKEGNIFHTKIPSDSISNDRLEIKGDGFVYLKYSVPWNGGHIDENGKYQAVDISKVFELTAKGLRFVRREVSDKYEKVYTD